MRPNEIDWADDNMAMDIAMTSKMKYRLLFAICLHNV